MTYFLQVPCFMRQYFPQTVANLTKTLKALNIEFIESEQQTCCGFPYFENGQMGNAKKAGTHHISLVEHAQISPDSNCFHTFKEYYPKIFNNSLLHNDCMKLSNETQYLNLIYSHITNSIDLEGNNYFALLTNEHDRIFLQNFKNGNILHPLNEAQIIGSEFNWHKYNPTESEKITLQLIKECLDTNCSLIIINDSIGRKHIENVALKNNLNISTYHIIDIIAKHLLK